MEMKDRIRQVMEARKMTQNEFAAFLQQTPGTVSSIFNGRTRPTLNIVNAIKRCIPDISLDWLMFGEGDMFKTLPVEQETVGETLDYGAEQMLPFDVPQGQMPVQSPSQVHGVPSGHPSPRSSEAQNHYGVKSTHFAIPSESTKYFDREPRKVTEIRVYYDDQTYETFVPAPSK